jgi:hypothetical protein
MVRISVSEAAFKAIVDILPLGSVAYEAALDDWGGRAIWIEARAIDKLTALRRADESYSDVILRLVEIEANSRSRA